MNEGYDELGVSVRVSIQVQVTIIRSLLFDRNGLECTMVPRFEGTGLTIDHLR